MTDLPDMTVVAADLDALRSERGPILLELDVFAAFCLVGQVQLALRHPNNFGLSAETAAQFARNLSDHLPESAKAVIAAGWDPKNDG